MNRRAPSPRLPRAPVAHVWGSPARDTDNMLSEIREHAQRGRRVHVMRAGSSGFEIVLNGSQFLVRAREGDVVGTFDNIMAGVIAGDRHLDHRDEDDFGDDEPKGVA